MIFFGIFAYLSTSNGTVFAATHLQNEEIFGKREEPLNNAIVGHSTVEDETTELSRNVGYQSSRDAVPYPRKTVPSVGMYSFF